MDDLTARQCEVLELIRATVKEKGFPPTVRELAEKLGVNSPYGVLRHLAELAQGLPDAKRGEESYADAHREETCQDDSAQGEDFLIQSLLRVHAPSVAIECGTLVFKRATD